MTLTMGYTRKFTLDLSNLYPFLTAGSRGFCAERYNIRHTLEVLREARRLSPTGFLFLEPRALTADS